MAALSDYLESGLLHHIFRGETFNKPSGIAIALTSGVPRDSDTGFTIPELPSGIGATDTGYTRINLGNPVDSGNVKWNYSSADNAVGSGVIKNASSYLFDTALTDWGWVSGIAICDNATPGNGNVLMHATLDNPRIIYTGDSVKFDADTLQISFK
jgi:hypothetical protein